MGLPQLRYLLPLLIVVAHTHCVLTHGAELRWLAEVSVADESPVNEPPRCGNEFGCICRGATLASEARVSVLDEALPLLAWSLVCTVDFGIATDPVESTGPSLLVDRAAGNAARAWLQSFRL